MIAAAPLSPHRSRSCALDCTAMLIRTFRPPMSAVSRGSGIGEMIAASSNSRLSGGSSRPPGWFAAIRLPSRAICAVNAVTNGAVCASSAPSM